MSAFLFALLVIALAGCLGVVSADVSGKLSYRLFNAEVGSEKSIIRALGAVLGLGCGLAAVQVGNYAAGFYGPPLAVLWVTAVFLVLVGVGKLLVAIFG